MAELDLTEEQLEWLLIMDPFRYKVLKDEKTRHETIDKTRFNHPWRIDMLAVPRGHTEEVEMFHLTPEEQDNHVQRKMRAQKMRMENAKSDAKMHQQYEKLVIETVNNLRYLAPGYYETQKKLYKTFLGKPFQNRMNTLIENSLNTPYREYEKARRTQKLKRKKEAARKKGKKVKPKTPAQLKAERKARLAEIIEHCKSISVPKKVLKPPPIKRGKHGDLSPETMARITVPKFFSPKFVAKTVKELLAEHTVPLSALSYMASNRVCELAIPKYVVQPEVVQIDVVEPSALVAKATPRMIELAVPKPRSARVDNDVKEEAFKISPNALKYQATERIIELAKPVFRK